MKITPIVIAAVCTKHLFAHANHRVNIDDGDTDRVLQGERGNGEKQGGGTPPYVPGQFLVKFKPGKSEVNRGQAMEAARSSVGEKILTAAMRGAGDAEGVTVMMTTMTVPEAVQAILASGTVEYAEPNYIYKHDATSNDPYVTSSTISTQLWGMYSQTATGGGKANQYGIGATTAWQNDKTDCSSVYVGIIDEGVMLTHPDLVANAGTNPGEIPNNEIDDDGNGYIDDVFGWDFFNNDRSVYDSGDGDAHGTHVAGTIGGVGGNGIGVAGVCWSVKLLSGKFLGPETGSASDAVRAVDYFTDLKERQGLNIVATNNSWGGGGYSQALYDAIQRAKNMNILFVAAAGNSGTNNDSTPYYPSNYALANVIAVASITSTGALSSFSQYGATTVDIGAPGSDIWSTVPGIFRYESYDGTSMATPHVTGAAALYKALYPQATAAQIKAAILNGATATSSLNGKVVTGGRLNVAGFSTLLTSPTPTTQPTPMPTFNPQLTSGQKLTLSITTTGLAQQFYIAVPSLNMITCRTTGGIGDSDLYVKFDSQPTSSSYDDSSTGSSTDEVVGPLIASASDRTLYVMVFAYTPFSYVELWCDFVPQLTSGQKLTLSIPTAKLAQQFYIAVPSSNMITCRTAGGSGDSDLYIKFGSMPTSSSYDDSSTGSSTNEVVGPLIASASDRTLYVMVFAWTPFIDVELWCEYTTSKPTSKPTLPSTRMPTTRRPTTRRPTSRPTTRRPTTRRPTSRPTTPRPTSRPTTPRPTTSKPATRKPTSL